MRVFELTCRHPSESIGIIITEKDLEYITKLIFNDVNYRTRRTAERAYKNVNGDRTAIAKATELRDGILAVLKGDNDAGPTPKRI